jgi:hypothetical protein
MGQTLLFTQIAGGAGIRDDAVCHGDPERNFPDGTLLCHINETGYTASLGEV